MTSKMSHSEGALKGRRPERSWNRITPTPQQSAAAVAGSSFNTSGLTYSGVPTKSFTPLPWK